MGEWPKPGTKQTVPGRELMTQRALVLGVGCTDSWLGARPERQSDMTVPSPAAWPFVSPRSLTVRLL